LTDLRYIGRAGQRFIFEIKDGETLIGYGSIIEAYPDDAKLLLAHVTKLIGG